MTSRTYEGVSYAVQDGHLIIDGEQHAETIMTDIEEVFRIGEIVFLRGPGITKRDNTLIFYKAAYGKPGEITNRLDIALGFADTRLATLYKQAVREIDNLELNLSETDQAVAALRDRIKQKGRDLEATVAAVESFIEVLTKYPESLEVER